MIKAPGSRKIRKGFVSSRPLPTFCRVFSLLDKNNMDEIKINRLRHDKNTSLKSEFKLITLVADRPFIGACNKILSVSTKTETKHYLHLRKGLPGKDWAIRGVIKDRFDLYLSKFLPDIHKSQLLESNLLSSSKGARYYSKTVVKFWLMFWIHSPFHSVLSTRRSAEQRPAKLGASGEVSSNL